MGDLNVRYLEFVHGEIPRPTLEAWSAAICSDTHLDHQSPEELHERILFAVIAVADDRMVGFAGLVRAHAAAGGPLRPYRGRIVVELGGAYVDPGYRGRHIWRELLRRRLAYARTRLNGSHRIVCVTSNPVVQNGLGEAGLRPLRDQVLTRRLCWECAHGCPACPRKLDTAWYVREMPRQRGTN